MTHSTTDLGILPPMEKYQDLEPLKDFFVTFGQNHTHILKNKTLDKDTILRIVARDKDQAHKTAHELFGFRWSMIYESCPDLKYFPGGVVDC